MKEKKEKGRKVDWLSGNAGLQLNNDYFSLFAIVFLI